VTPKPGEDVVLKQLSQELRRTHVLTDEQKTTLSKVFEKRLAPALGLVEAKSVTRYRFKPSGRTVWIVRGRKGDYQVMPESKFCTCDDYYFRVMDNKKQLCYHLVAQQIAEALGKFDTSDQSDSRYPELTAKWNSKASSRRIWRFLYPVPEARLWFGRAVVSYSLDPNAEYSLLQLLLYIFSFVALVLIFFYIASERPAEKKKKDEED
jgi:predicted nucleic acid-binding Zn finger protein